MPTSSLLLVQRTNANVSSFRDLTPLPPTHQNVQLRFVTQREGLDEVQQLLYLYSIEQCSRNLTSGTASIGRKPDSRKFPVRSESFHMQNVQRYAGPLLVVFSPVSGSCARGFSPPVCRRWTAPCIEHPTGHFFPRSQDSDNAFFCCSILNHNSAILSPMRAMQRSFPTQP
jgi:hypothetical protein